MADPTPKINLGQKLDAQNAKLDCIIQSDIAKEIFRIKENIARDNPNAISLHGFKVYSQFDEDGIIQRIFDIIGEKTKTFVEIGSGNGKENNSHYLLLKGWRGVWMEADQNNIKVLRDGLGLGRNPILAIQNKFITRDNVNDEIQKGLDNLSVKRSNPHEIDFLSIDIDGNDLTVLDHISIISPRVICAEYNAKFPPPTEVVMNYDPKFQWEEARDDYQGASLQSFVNVLAPKGYQLICCGLSGVNAFFVKASELSESILPRQQVERLYEPCRYHFILKSSGHRPSLKFLRRLINKKDC